MAEDMCIVYAVEGLELHEKLAEGGELRKRELLVVVPDDLDAHGELVDVRLAVPHGPACVERLPVAVDYPVHSPVLDHAVVGLAPL